MGKYRECRIYIYRDILHDLTKIRSQKIFIWPLQICSQKTSLYGQLIIMYKFKLYLVFRQEEKALDDEYSR